jgi:hypothetical protein
MIQAPPSGAAPAPAALRKRIRGRALEMEVASLTAVLGGAALARGLVAQRTKKQRAMQ